MSGCFIGKTQSRGAMRSHAKPQLRTVRPPQSSRAPSASRSCSTCQAESSGNNGQYIVFLCFLKICEKRNNLFMPEKWEHDEKALDSVALTRRFLRFSPSSRVHGPPNFSQASHASSSCVMPQFHGRSPFPHWISIPTRPEQTHPLKDDIPV